MMAKRDKWGVFMQVLCLGLAFFMLFPILYAVSVSLMEQKAVLASPPHFLPPKVAFDNYVTAFTRTTLPRYMVNSFVVAVICSVSRVLVACMSAFAFSFMEFKGKKLLFFLTLSTMMIPPDVLIVANFTTVSRLRLVNTYMGICVVYLVSAANIFMLRQHFLGFSKSLKEAAAIDGCGNLRFFFSILMPTSRPVVTTVFLSSFVNVWNQYVWPMLVTNKNELRTIQVGITMLKDRESAVFGPVMAGVVVALVPTVLLFIVFQKQIVAGMMSGAVKE